MDNIIYKKLIVVHNDKQYKEYEKDNNFFIHFDIFNELSNDPDTLFFLMLRDKNINKIIVLDKI